MAKIRSHITLVAVFMLLALFTLSFGAQRAKAFGGNDVSFQQCANGKMAPFTCSWINGIVQQSNSVYAEDMALPQRLLFTSLDDFNAPGDIFKLEFKHESTKAGIHAFDWLVGWGQAGTLANDLGLPYATVPLNGNHILDNFWPDPIACQGYNGATLATCEALNGDMTPMHFIDVMVPDDGYVDSLDCTRSGQVGQEGWN